MLECLPDTGVSHNRVLLEVWLALPQEKLVLGRAYGRSQAIADCHGGRLPGSQYTCQTCQQADRQAACRRVATIVSESQWLMDGQTDRQIGRQTRYQADRHAHRSAAREDHVRKPRSQNAPTGTQADR